jgi:site-specific DNA recombinase
MRKLKRAARGTTPRVRGGVRRYQLVGLLRCGLCRRRMESCWSHGRPAYRCQHGHSSARPRGAARMRNLYVREDRMIVIIRALLRRGHCVLELVLFTVVMRSCGRRLARRVARAMLVSPLVRW